MCELTRFTERKLFAKQVHAEATVVAELNSLRRFLQHCATVTDVRNEIDARVSLKVERMQLDPAALWDGVEVVDCERAAQQLEPWEPSLNDGRIEGAPVDLTPWRVSRVISRRADNCPSMSHELCNIYTGEVCAFATRALAQAAADAENAQGGAQ